MIITFFDLEKDEEEYFKDKLKNYRVFFLKSSIDEHFPEEAKKSEIISVFIHSNLDKKILSQFKKLRAITTRSVGYDHIDLSWCKKNRIDVLNIPHYGDNTVAEHTLALILNLSRKIIQSNKRVRECKFDQEGLEGFDLKGKTLGIIGLGNIGSNVAKMAKGFDMNIIYYDKIRKKELEKSLEIGYRSKIKNILNESDILSLHTPLNKETEHLINLASLKELKKGIYIINTSRGKIIDTKALIEGLNSGIIAGLGLDVLEDEESIKEEKELLSKKHTNEQICNILEEHILMTYPNVIITPHNAFNSRESIQRIKEMTIENIISIINKKPINLVK